MSFVSLCDNALVKINKGAQKEKFYYNTSEGGLNQFHEQRGGLYS